MLNAVDKDTKLIAACFIDGESTKYVWEAFVRIWTSLYGGFLDSMATDQGRQFFSEEWRMMLRSLGITEKVSGVDRHNSLSLGDIYHVYLRGVYKKVRADTPGLTTEQ